MYPIFSNAPVFQPEISELNFKAWLNMLRALVTERISHCEISLVKLCALLNIALIFVQRLTSQAERSLLNAWVIQNIPVMSTTRDTFHLERSGEIVSYVTQVPGTPLRGEANRYDMLVTSWVSQSLMSPYVAVALLGNAHHSVTAVTMLSSVMGVRLAFVVMLLAEFAVCEKTWFEVDRAVVFDATGVSPAAHAIATATGNSLRPPSMERDSEMRRSFPGDQRPQRASDRCAPLTLAARKCSVG